MPADEENMKSIGNTRPHRQENGRHVAVKNTASATNAKPMTVVISNGGHSQWLRSARFDKRSTAYKAYKAEVEDLVGHIGENRLSAPLRRLVDQAARLSLIENAAWAALNDARRIVTGKGPHPALEVYMKVSRERRAILQMLGIERKEKVIPDLQEYLESNYGKTEHGEEDPNDH